MQDSVLSCWLATQSRPSEGGRCLPNDQTSQGDLPDQRRSRGCGWDLPDLGKDAQLGDVTSPEKGTQEPTATTGVSVLPGVRATPS